VLQNGHYEIDWHHGPSRVITRYVYRPRELPAVINSIIDTGGAIIAIREVETGSPYVDGTYDPNWAYNTCCGKCVGGTCYVDAMTGA
jgi:hypothetical protein